MAATPNPWVALDVFTDPVAHARALARAHERGVSGRAAAVPGVRELVMQTGGAASRRGWRPTPPVHLCG